MAPARKISSVAVLSLIAASICCSTLGGATPIVAPQRQQQASSQQEGQAQQHRQLLDYLTDVNILNFALNLECLEAEFYSYAAFGEGLTADLRGGGPEPIGGMKANLTEEISYYAKEIATNEIDHVAFLRTALGEYAVPCPLIDIGPAFAGAANAAVTLATGTDTTLDPPYNPYYNDAWFLLGAFIFEDVGVTAYKGASPAVISKGILEAAAGILGVEAYHAGAVRSLLIERADDVLTPYPVDVKFVANAVSGLRAAIGGGAEVPLTDEDGNYYSVAADENSVAYSRTVEQVLSIVYGGNYTTPGLFFPEGINTYTPPPSTCTNSRYSQCGGKNFKGETCCPGGFMCSVKDKWFSQCKPMEDPSCSNKVYAQCGGEDYTGDTCCPTGSTCKEMNKYFSQCSYDSW